MTYLSSIIDIFAVLLFLVAIRAIRDYQRRKGLPYPPGPRPLPILGNVLDIPKQFPWLAYSKFSKKYGKPQHSVWQKFSSDMNIRGYLVLSNVWASYHRIEHRRSCKGSP
jgi:hypothetical protein